MINSGFSYSREQFNNGEVLKLLDKITSKLPTQKTKDEKSSRIKEELIERFDLIKENFQFYSKTFASMGPGPKLWVKNKIQSLENHPTIKEEGVEIRRANKRKAAKRDLYQLQKQINELGIRKTRTEENPNEYEYSRGDKEAEKIVSPSKRKPLGRGAYGTVKEHSQYKSLVLKKQRIGPGSRATLDSCRNEFKIGQKLKDHPLFVSMRAMFVKKGEEKAKVKFISDKVEGKTLGEAKVFSMKRKECKHFLRQAKEASMHLVDKKIIWEDLNPGNIFVTDEGNLKFNDYGLWTETVHSENLKKILKPIPNLIFQLSSKVTGFPNPEENLSIPENLDKKQQALEFCIQKLTTETAESLAINKTFIEALETLEIKLNTKTPGEIKTFLNGIISNPDELKAFIELVFDSFIRHMESAEMQETKNQSYQKGRENAPPPVGTNKVRINVFEENEKEHNPQKVPVMQQLMNMDAQCTQ